MTESIKCYVVVSGEHTDDDDDGVAGFYELELRVSKNEIDFESPTQAQQTALASAALDEWHENNGVEVLDDFEITVYLANGVCISEVEDEVPAALDVECHYFGPVSEEDLPFHLESPRYVVSTGWGHIFVGKREETTRWIYDREEAKLVNAQVLQSGQWIDLSSSDCDDLCDSIVNGNDAIENVDEFDLLELDEIAPWDQIVEEFQELPRPAEG